MNKKLISKLCGLLMVGGLFTSGVVVSNQVSAKSVSQITGADFKDYPEGFEIFKNARKKTARYNNDNCWFVAILKELRSQEGLIDYLLKLRTVDELEKDLQMLKEIPIIDGVGLLKKGDLINKIKERKAAMPVPVHKKYSKRTTKRFHTSEVEIMKERDKKVMAYSMLSSSGSIAWESSIEFACEGSASRENSFGRGFLSGILSRDMSCDDMFGDDASDDNIFGDDTSDDDMSDCCEVKYKRRKK